MPDVNAIRAGGASVEVRADYSSLGQDLAASEKRLRDYGNRVAEIDKETRRKIAELGKTYEPSWIAQHPDKDQRTAVRAALKQEAADLVEKRGLAEQLAAKEEKSYKQWSAGQRDVSADLGARRQRIELEDRFFAATHSNLEVSLREHAAYYAQLRTRHAGNARMLALIDQTYFAERKRLIANDAAGGGLGFFGNRRLARQGLRYSLSTLAGMEGGPGGLIASAALEGTTTGMAGIAAALAVIGVLYQKAKEHATQLTKAQEQHAKAVRESERWMRQMAVSQVETTGAGGQYRSRAEELRESAAEIDQSVQKSIKDIGIFDAAWMGVQSLWRGGLENTDYGLWMRERGREMQEVGRQARSMERWTKVEDLFAADTRKSDRASTLTAAQLPNQYEGEELQRRQLKQKDEDEQRKLKAAYDEKIRVAQRQAEASGKNEDMDRVTDLVLERIEAEKNLKAVQAERWKAAEKGWAEEAAQMEKAARASERQRNEAEDDRKKNVRDVGAGLWRREFMARAGDRESAQNELEQNDLQLQMIALMATPKQIAKALEKLKDVQALEFAQTVKDSVKTPVEKFKEYREKLAAAQSLGNLSSAQVSAALRNKMAEFMTVSVQSVSGYTMGGRALQGESASLAVQRQIADATEETAKNTLDLLDKLDETMPQFT